MATTTQLGGVFMKDTDGNIASGSSASTENTCGLIFDVAGLLAEGDDLSDLPAPFTDGDVVEFTTSKEIEDLEAIEDIKALVGGIPYYHMSTFFDVAGQNQSLYVAFTDSSKTGYTEFEAIQLMQTAADGLIYQIGVWTPTPSAKSDSGTLVDNGLYEKLEAQAEALGGKVGTVNQDGNSPVNIILNAPVSDALIVDYTALPDVSSLNYPKVTHILGQASSDDIHKMQAQICSATKNIPVGNIGAALGVLAIAPAEVSIAYVADFNLSGVMQACELGFGAVTYTAASGSGASAVPASVSGTFNKMKSITYTQRQNNLHKNGYVFLTPIEGIRNGVFFSSDQTLSTGDYRTISRCRVMHKSRRVVRQALLAKVNAPVSLDASTGEMSSADITEYQNLVLNALDNNMYEPGTTVSQISGRGCTIDSSQNVLTNDSLEITYAIVPIGCTAAIYVTEGFAGSVSE